MVPRAWRRSSGVGGGDGLPSGLDLDAAVAAGGLDEFPNGPACLCLDPADGDGSEHDREVAQPARAGQSALLVFAEDQTFLTVR